MNFLLGRVGLDGRTRPGPKADSVLLCVQIPKSGSSSLSVLLHETFADRRVFYLPNTYDADGAVSPVYRYRFRRSQRRNLSKRYGSSELGDAFETISAKAKPGDLIDGGHIAFGTTRENVSCKLRMITILRDPVTRSLSEYNYARAAFEQRSAVRKLTAPLMPKIAGTRDFDGFLDFMEENRDVYGNIASRYIGWDGASELSTHFAQNMFHAGVLEDTAGFARGLSEKLGKDLVFPHRNRTSRKTITRVTPRQRERIEHLYARDIALYEWVREHL